MRYKSTLTQLIEDSHQAELTIAAQLTARQRQAKGKLKDWAFKEIIAHLAIWKKRELDNLQGALSGQPFNRYENYLELNDQNFADFQRMTWPEIEQFSAQVHRDYINLLHKMTEADLIDKHLSPDSSRPLWSTIISTYTHTLMHLSDIYAKRGNLDLANQLQDNAVQSLYDLDPGNEWKGTLRYNLACYYAVSGQKDKAIPVLREALSLNPTLLEWSKKDTDLESLHQDPGYQALYQ